MTYPYRFLLEILSNISDNVLQAHTELMNCQPATSFFERGHVIVTVNVIDVLDTSASSSPCFVTSETLDLNFSSILHVAHIVIFEMFSKKVLADKPDRNLRVVFLEQDYENKFGLSLHPLRYILNRNVQVTHCFNIW